MALLTFQNVNGELRESRPKILSGHFFRTSAHQQNINLDVDYSTEAIKFDKLSKT